MDGGAEEAKEEQHKKHHKQLQQDINHFKMQKQQKLTAPRHQSQNIKGKRQKQLQQDINHFKMQKQQKLTAPRHRQKAKTLKVIEWAYGPPQKLSLYKGYW